MKQVQKKISSAIVLSCLILSPMVSFAGSETYSLGNRTFDDSDYAVVSTMDGASGEISVPTKINGNLSVTSFAFTAGDGNNLVITGMADGATLDYKWNIILTKGNLTYTSIWTSSSAGNIYVYWNVDCSTLESQGNVYVYGDLKCTSVDVKGKLKVTGKLDGSTLSKGRLYSFGGKNTYTSTQKDTKPESGFFGKVDPFLIFNLSDTKISDIKNIISASTSKVSTLKTELSAKYAAKDYSRAQTLRKEIYDNKVAVFEDLKPYVENTDFDRKKMEDLKVYELGTTVNYLNGFTALWKFDVTSSVSMSDPVASPAPTTAPQTPSTTSSAWSSLANPLPASLIASVDRKISSIPADKQEAWIGGVIEKLEILEKKKLSKKNLALIVSLKAYLELQLEKISMGDGGEDVLNIFK